MSRWIQHIKDFAAKNNLSYGCALSNPECSRTYRATKEKQVGLEESIPQFLAQPLSKVGTKGIEIAKPYVPKVEPFRRKVVTKGADKLKKQKKKVIEFSSAVFKEKRTKKPLRKDLKNELDKLFEKIIYIRDNLLSLQDQIGRYLDIDRTVTLEDAINDLNSFDDEWRQIIYEDYNYSSPYADKTPNRNLVESKANENIIKRDSNDNVVGYRKTYFDLLLPRVEKALDKINDQFEDAIL